MNIVTLLLAVLPLTAAGSALDGWLDAATGGDSLSPGMGVIEGGGMLRGDLWNLTVQGKYVVTDTTEITRKFLDEYSVIDVNFKVREGATIVNPDLVWIMDFNEKTPKMVLPDQGGMAFRHGYYRPGLGLETAFVENFRLNMRGLYWNLAAEHEDGSDLGWTGFMLDGRITWDSPWNTSFQAGAVTRKSAINKTGYAKTWNRYDVGVSLHPGGMPRNMYLTGGVTYSVYDGRDFLQRDIPDRLIARIRLMQMGVLPSVTAGTSFESVFDFDGNEIRMACTALEAGLIWKFMKKARVPSTAILSGKLTRSAIRTQTARLFTRVHVFRGLSVLAQARARISPTYVAGAGPYRKSYVAGPGLEYRFGNKIRIWGIIEHERTNLTGNENWWRIKSGLELYPGTVSF